MLNLNDANYKDVLKEGRIIVDVWQDNCSDCQRFAPLFRAFSKLNQDAGLKFANFKVGRQGPSEFRREFLTFDKDEKAASPTIILFENGKMLRRVCGYVSSMDFEQFVSVGMPKKLSEYNKTDLEALAYRKIQSIDLHQAFVEDCHSTIAALNEEISKR